MTKDDYRHFVCIVAGSNPDELMKEYDKKLKVSPYTVYKKCDAGKLRNLYLESLKKSLEGDIDIYSKQYTELSIEDIDEMTDDEFYEEFTEKYIIDESTGDALSDENPKGKWTSYNIGKIFCLPFLTKDGKEVFQELKKNIDWDKIHCGGGDVYSRAWEMVMENSEPTTDEERMIYENMKDKKAYFLKFENKDNYVISNTAFWGYAFLSEKTGWIDADDCEDQFVWMATYYDMFIRNVKEDELLTIYECIK